MANAPIRKYKRYGIQIDVWENTRDDGSKNNSYTLSKSWKKKDSDEWQKQSINLFENDLLNLSCVLQRATSSLVKAESNTNAQASTAPASTPPQDIDDEIPF